jgi:hypothetical protein
MDPLLLPLIALLAIAVFGGLALLYGADTRFDHPDERDRR